MRLRAASLRLILASTLVVTGCNARVQVADGRWTADCFNTSLEDCRGVAELFVNNLAWGEGAVHDESGGFVQVTYLPSCPIPVADPLEPGSCWRAAAPTRTQRACMLVGRQKDPNLALMPFGQAGGDEYTGRLGAPKPGTTPC